jgi:hypothetical protein
MTKLIAPRRATTKQSKNLLPRWQDELREAVEQFIRTFELLFGQFGKGFDPRNQQFITWVLFVIVIMLASAVLAQGLRRLWPLLGSP